MNKTIKPMKMKTMKVILDEEMMRLLEKFRTEFKDGNVPMKYLMPFLVLLGMRAYKRGFRMEKDINLEEADR